ncbi:ferrous iron transport protein A [Nakamurella deserti]|uniref:putative acetyltransferase n=1 Tax=Nakamurella deserti TaxID=2164074 RepID=UPI000DBE97EE|nr:ferrous iron transport protein A [Nakamurella deserti]
MNWGERLRSLPTGTRVVIRYLIEGGATDALGDLLEVGEDRCTVRTRRGDVVIALAGIVAAKPVPPPPVRRPPRAPRGSDPP